MACGPQKTVDTAGSAGTVVPYAPIESKLVFDGPLTVVPNTRWALHESTGAWMFRSYGRLLCIVDETPEQPLVLSLRPTAETSEHFFEVQWNRVRLPAESIRKVGDDFEITIEPGDLPPGRHELLVRRHRPPKGKAPASQSSDNVFTRLAWSLGEEVHTLEVTERHIGQQIAEFVDHGVLGEDTGKRGGVLFAHPGDHRLELPGTGGHLRIAPRNFSTRPARFHLSDGQQHREVELAPGEQGSLDLDMAAGTDALTLRVTVPGSTGAADTGAVDNGDTAPGPYLWGTPRYRPAEATDTDAVAASGGASPPPSIILVTLDTTRRDAFGPYGGRQDINPHLMAFAEHATVFEQAFSTSPWTLPSHASIFTGLYPTKHRAGVSDIQLPVGTTTLADLLRRRGYFTAGISAGELSSSRFGLAQGFHEFRNPEQFETPGERVDAQVGEILDRWRRPGSTEESTMAESSVAPLFLWINYFDAHAIYQAPAEYEKALGVPSLAKALDGVPVWGNLTRHQMGAWRAAVEGEAEVTPPVMEYLTAAYLAEVAYLDHLMGRLFDRLRAEGLYENSMIIVTSDHGELLGERGYVSHGARLDPELVEIPLIIKWPGQRQPDRDDRLASLVDLFPTILGAAGLTPPPSDGRWLGDPSRHPGGTDPGDPWRRFVVLEEHEFLIHPLPKFMKVARNLYGIQREDFRQLAWEDGDECARLRDGQWILEPCTAGRDGVLASLAELLHIGDHAAPAMEGELSDEERESLEALGYM